MNAPYREADVPSPVPPNTAESALGAVLAALHGLDDDTRENVLLAAATLYQLRIDFVDSDAEQSTGFVSVLDVERIAAAVRGER